MKCVVLAGPTGSGKSRLAVRLALAAGGEIVNYDSVQIYRGFDIGSAKPSLEDRAAVPHHLFDIADGDEEFNASVYARIARETCEDIAGRGKLPILAGGTFFYLRALLHGLPEMPGRDERVRERLRAISNHPSGPRRLHRWLSRVDPATAQRVAPADRHRVERALEVWITSGSPISSHKAPSAADPRTDDVLMLALRLERGQIVGRIGERVEAMYRAGLVRETRDLSERYPDGARAFDAIGYREALGVVRGELSEEQAVAETARRTRAYAKRQMTWLRSERNVHWLDAADEETTFRAALQLVERFNT